MTDDTTEGREQAFQMMDECGSHGNCANEAVIYNGGLADDHESNPQKIMTDLLFKYHIVFITDINGC